MFKFYFHEVKPLSVYRIDFSFARSSGPGGQNVNKLNTKAEMRFHVPSASWLAPEVRQRLIEYNPNKINKEGELYIASQEHRTQSKNKDDCLSKLKELIAEAMLTPKEREMWVGISEKTKQKRKEEKRKRGEVKNNRKKFKDFDD
jgi:protein subunit release factor B